MKLPGKRDRQRRASSASLPALQGPPRPEGSLPAPAPTAPAQPAGTPDPGAREPLGPCLALAPARAFRSPAAWVAVSYLFVAGAFHVVDLETRRSSAPTPAPNDPSVPAPRATSDAPQVELDPLLAMEDPEPGATGEPPRLAAERLAGPLPPALPPVAGDGGQALLDALSRAPAAPLMVRRELTRLGLDPDASASDDALAWVRACEPAVTALAHAARCERFDSSKIAWASSSVDLRALHDLGVAALCVGRMHTRGGAPALGAAPALDLVQVGHGLGRCGSPIEAAAGVALARLGERWLARSLERDPWSREELQWLQDRLTPIAGARGELARTTASGPAQRTDGIDVAAALARTTTQELGALAALAERCAQKLDRTEGGAQ